MTETRHLTRQEAAEDCGCSVDALRRDERAGQLPNRRARADGVIEIVIADLVDCGRLDKLSATAPLQDIATKGRTQRGLDDARHSLSLKDVQIEALVLRAQSADEEIAPVQ
jgi:polyhydroxyalkanoate synthesis regulator phasin